MIMLDERTRNSKGLGADQWNDVVKEARHLLTGADNAKWAVGELTNRIVAVGRRGHRRNVDQLLTEFAEAVEEELWFIRNCRTVQAWWREPVLIDGISPISWSSYQLLMSRFETPKAARDFVIGLVGFPANTPSGRWTTARIREYLDRGGGSRDEEPQKNPVATDVQPSSTGTGTSRGSSDRKLTGVRGETKDRNDGPPAPSAPVSPPNSIDTSPALTPARLESWKTSLEDVAAATAVETVGVTPDVRARLHLLSNEMLGLIESIVDRIGRGGA